MKYFTIEELCYSATAEAAGVVNEPTEEIESRLRVLTDECLDLIREEYGKPITVSSGYRCKTLNRLVGGKENSQHINGEAADLVGKSENETRKIFETAKHVGVYDQLLYERSRGKVWVHISHKATGDRHMLIENYRV